MPTRGALATLVVFCLLPAALAGRITDQADHSSRSALTGVYNTAQATRGEQTYMNICVACHPAGTYATPVFKTSWTGRPMSDLFDVVKERMPKSDPGSLTPEEVAQVLAYLLKINDVPSGEAELSSDVAELKKILFETPTTHQAKAPR